MEPIASWSEERVTKWLQGLDAPMSQYQVSEWSLSGAGLLSLTSLDLEKLGVHKIGHQELILEAVEKLCSLSYGFGGESLKVLTEKLSALAHTLQMNIQSRWRLNGYDGRSTTKLSTGVLTVVVELITSAKGLFSLLNRYQFFQLSGYTDTKDILNHCKQLGDIVHKETTVYEKEKEIISVCRQLVEICDEILNSSPDTLLTHTAQLESVDLVPVAPGDQLGIEITSTSSSNHYVTGAAAEPSTDAYLRVLAGDEVVQVNDQIVVGWSRANLLKKLQENSNGVTLVLKKIPASIRRKTSIKVFTVQTEEREEEEREEKSEEEEETDKEESTRHSILERVAASVRSLSFRRAIQEQEPPQQPMGQEESELPFDKELEGSLTVHSNQNQPGRLSPLPASGANNFPASSAGEFRSIGILRLSPSLRRDRSPSFRRSVSPLTLTKERASFSSCPEMVGHTTNKETKKSSTKGMTTSLSRRRVSCRELDHPDCDGWLWKKRRESSVFITQKWQRFWFVLQGPILYWYNSQQDEKAEGLLNIASYKVESAGEHKRKYVFQMSHRKFQNFFFATETATDLSKWINCLITATQKHRKLQKGPDSEEECYSETESEGESSPSPRRKNKPQFNTVPRTKGNPNKVPAEGSKGTAAPVDEMGMMLNNLKEGGVSLIGHEQPLTQDHFRKSFIRRNKNPVINEKALTLRALQSTLKAKEAELQQINKMLDDPHLTVTKFRLWKKQNEELMLEIQKLASQKAPAGDKDVAPAQDTPAKEVALETVATEPATAEAEGAYGLSLSDGEQLVDAELSDIFPEIPSRSLSPDADLELDFSLGSLGESINKHLSENAGSVEHSFYI
ncbi:connector enhancer of kinase suppressor of ras 1 isoform X2 [Austrofundulus limnaeus]|uniref:Connector enhancer of kinase suppressor of ras 1 isoform X2 n=1 Tax=Austrofundulus limnaeus TaxID=52670 RepID=A0A2I4BSU1_AUSLI|nr:PREDICTED: connector enhancer of kinase suppressor of ras 2-like isoform X2 [Austrofundulus limnaeus]